MLPDGYSKVAPGKIVTVVSFLEMTAEPQRRPDPAGMAWELRRVERPDPVWYRDLFRRVGENWLWFSRLQLAEDRLAAILHDPDVEIYALSAEGRDEGLLELDFRAEGACELAFFGLTGAVIGGGGGRFLMNRALERVWARPGMARFWVHTCTLDHPAALGFYRRSGFRVYGQAVEVADDPRLIGLAPRDAAPHVPIIEG